MKDIAKKSAGTTRSNKPDGDLGAGQVQEQVDAENEQGFRGTKVDPTPDENYTMQTPPDAPTPETDAGAARAAREALGIGKSGLEANAEKGGEK